MADKKISLLDIINKAKEIQQPGESLADAEKRAIIILKA